MYSEPSTPKFSCSCSSESVMPICTWNFQSFKKFFYKNWQSTIQSHIFQVFDYAIFPCGIISLFHIKKYGCHVFFFGKSFSYEGFQADKVITIVLLVFLIRVGRFVINLFFWRNHISLLLIICSSVLQIQLVKAIGW